MGKKFEPMNGKLPKGKLAAKREAKKEKEVEFPSKDRQAADAALKKKADAMGKGKADYERVGNGFKKGGKVKTKGCKCGGKVKTK